MAGFMYYIPSVTQREVNDAVIVDRGLGYALIAGRSVREVMKGPDGKAGVVVAHARRVEPGKVGYFADQQAWRQIPQSECWVGMYTDDRPKPQDLLVDQPLSGHPVKLADDQSYMIPTALMYVDEHKTFVRSLPTKTDLDAEGNWTLGNVCGAYADLEDLALEFWQAFAGGLNDDEPETGEAKPNQFDFQGLSDAALKVLATNYVVGKAEVALAGLFGGSSQQDIMLALIDWPGFQAICKKKAEEETPAS